MTRRGRRPPAVIADDALAAEITTRWVAAVRNRFDAAFSREWLETTLRQRLRDGDSLTFVIKVIEFAERDGDEIADAALREVGAELMERRFGRLGEGQILAYLQRAVLRPPLGRGRGRAWYDDYQRNIGICVLIKLACRVFGVHATRSQESRRPNRPQSGVSLITEGLSNNKVFIEEQSVQKHLWFGVPGVLAKSINDEEALADFARQWALAAPFLRDLMRR